MVFHNSRHRQIWIFVNEVMAFFLFLFFRFSFILWRCDVMIGVDLEGVRSVSVCNLIRDVYAARLG